VQFIKCYMKQTKNKNKNKKLVKLIRFVIVKYTTIFKFNIIYLIYNSIVKIIKSFLTYLLVYINCGIFI